MQKVTQKKIANQAPDPTAISLLEVYRIFLQKEKALYTTLNKFKIEEKLYLGFCWIPRSDN